MVAQAYNANSLGNRIEVHKSPSQPMAGRHGVQLSSPATGNTNRRILVKAGLSIKRDPVSKRTNTKGL
jgi:hypothetical protein